MKIKSILRVLWALLLLAIASSPLATAQDADVTFATPEEAITHYMQALVAADFSGIMQTLAIDEMSENFDFERQINRVQTLNFQVAAPSEYDFYAEINRALFAEQMLFQTKNLAHGLLSNEPALLDGGRIMLSPEEIGEFTNNFVAAVNPERLAQIQVVRIALPMPEIVQRERSLELWADLARIYGADELTERVVLFSFEDTYYYTGFTLLRYADEWKISRVSSVIGKSSPFGSPTLTTLAAFQELVGDE